MFDIIAISGKSGCGNTTISTLVSKKLNFTLINYTFRQIAEKYNISFEELLETAKYDFQYDKELDLEQIRLAKKGKCVLGSRLAIWLLDKNSFKVYLKASIEKRIQHISKRENNSLENIYRFTYDRDCNDTIRFLKLYEIDNNEYSFADLIIDIEHLGIDEIVDQIVNAYHRWKVSKIENA